MVPRSKNQGLWTGTNSQKNGYFDFLGLSTGTKGGEVVLFGSSTGTKDEFRKFEEYKFLFFTFSTGTKSEMYHFSAFGTGTKKPLFRIFVPVQRPYFWRNLWQHLVPGTALVQGSTRYQVLPTTTNQGLWAGTNIRNNGFFFDFYGTSYRYQTRNEPLLRLWYRYEVP